MSRVMNVFSLRAVSINNVSAGKRVNYFGFRGRVYFIYAKRAPHTYIAAAVRDRAGRA